MGKKKNKYNPPNLEQNIDIEDIFKDSSMSIFNDFGVDLSNMEQF